MASGAGGGGKGGGEKVFCIIHHRTFNRGKKHAQKDRQVGHKILDCHTRKHLHNIIRKNE